MRSAAVSKSLADLRQRPARTAFTVLTLMLAVASVSFLAIPTLIDRAMQREIIEGRLADVVVGLRPVSLSTAQLEDLSAIDNVAD